VVGLYGDPDVSWSIMLELELTESVTHDRLRRRLSQAVAEHAHLGRVPQLRVFADAGGLSSARAWFADAPYGDRDPLTRVAVSADGTRLLVAGHHGAVDGLGLVGLVGLILGDPLGSSVRGVPRTEQGPGFFSGSLRRLAEALRRPPARFQGTAVPGAVHGDWLRSGQLPARRLATADLVWAAHAALIPGHGVPRAWQPVFALGVSHRSGASPLFPGRDTAYMRVHTRALQTRAEVAARVRTTPLEPDFPATRSGGVGPMVARLLGSRLGATALVSNLGRLQGSRVSRSWFWPAAAGPHRVAIGCVTAESATTLTVRAGRGWFSERDVDALCSRLVAALELGE
jgi:hypothetical protein